MKLACLNLDCSHTQYLTEEQLNSYIDDKFHTCELCSYLSILVPNDYFIETNEALAALNNLFFIKGINFD